MIEIPNFMGEPRYMSDEVYEISKPNKNVPNFPKGTRVRLISGVDDSTTPGYHFTPGYVAVWHADATQAGAVGFLRTSLKKVS